MISVVPVLTDIKHLRMAAEWYANPSSDIWTILHSATKKGIIEAFRKATSEEMRCQLQGALNILESLNEQLTGARSMLDKLEEKQKQGKIGREV